VLKHTQKSKRNNMHIYRKKQEENQQII
jgi:hypothetical protein